MEDDLLSSFTTAVGRPESTTQSPKTIGHSQFYICEAILLVVCGAFIEKSNKQSISSIIFFDILRT